MHRAHKRILSSFHSYLGTAAVEVEYSGVDSVTVSGVHYGGESTRVTVALALDGRTEPFIQHVPTDVDGSFAVTFPLSSDYRGGVSVTAQSAAGSDTATVFVPRG